MQGEEPKAIMEKLNHLRPMSRDEARLITAQIKIKDLEEQVKRLRREKDVIEHCYNNESIQLQRAKSLLEDYAALPSELPRRKLDRKLSLFFPNIMKIVYERRQNTHNK